MFSTKKIVYFFHPFLFLGNIRLTFPEEVILAEERTTDVQRFHIIDARRRAALKMRKLKTLGKINERDEDTEEEPDESCSLSSTNRYKRSRGNKEGMRKFWVWEKRIRYNYTFREAKKNYET